MVATSSLLLAAAAAITSVQGLAMPHGFPRVAVPQEHFEVLDMRATTQVNPSAVRNTECLDRKIHIVFHEQNAAELAICGGMAGKANKKRCSAATAGPTTTGVAGSATFSLKAAKDGATIALTKARWEACVRAAREVCPTGTFKSVCVGGASSGDVVFSLRHSGEHSSVEEL